MLVTILANADGNQASAGSGIASLLVFMLIPVAMYFLLIRPQRRRQKEQAAMQSSIEVGDEVMTTSGVYGFITGFDGDIVWLEIDDDVQIRVARAAVQRKVDTGGSSAGDSSKPASAAPAADSTEADGSSNGN
jgi:preprotein translocase subunit YajC